MDDMRHFFNTADAVVVFLSDPMIIIGKQFAIQGIKISHFELHRIFAKIVYHIVYQSIIQTESKHSQINQR